ncbi:hypothetical protein [Corynebacterium kalidii]|uniref:Uncharacterized protein n=1 Tax=Corynebacterium kalidii TaxID=2931982 RepID=A0A9X2B055_9CORY|nr:hypothetical protein [Corynebacterium kalidii]MCJ7859272.1 hypothetical protein [Corynebacterium kalidii]
MADYEKINWQNGEAGGTPTSAENFNRMDDGIATAQSTADAAQSAADAAQRTADSKADPGDIPDVTGFVTQADIDSAVEGLAAASDIPDVSGLATQSDLDAALARIAVLEDAGNGA